MPYGIIAADTVQSSITGTPPVFKDGSSVETGQLCRAWGSFNGSTPGVNASFNVSSFSRTSTGFYSVTMSVSMSDSNYSYGTNHQYVSGSNPVDSDDLYGGWMVNNNQTSSVLYTFTRSNSSGALNCFRVLCHVFR